MQRSARVGRRTSRDPASRHSVAPPRQAAVAVESTGRLLRVDRQAACKRPLAPSTAAASDKQQSLTWTPRRWYRVVGAAPCPTAGREPPLLLLSIGSRVAGRVLQHEGDRPQTTGSDDCKGDVGAVRVRLCDAGVGRVQSPRISGAARPNRVSGATIASLESDRPDGPRVDDAYGDRALVPRPIRSVATPHGWIVAQALASRRSPGA